MTFTAEERNLIFLYRSGSREETIEEMRGALFFIDAPDTLAAVRNAVRKLRAMGGAEFAAFFESEARHAG
jgi:hypothetical protein